MSEFHFIIKCKSFELEKEKTERGRERQRQRERARETILFYAALVHRQIDNETSTIYLA